MEEQCSTILQSLCRRAWGVWDQAGPLAPSEAAPPGKCLAPCTAAPRAFG